ncbi:MAG TPA: YetF domain-containing protein [Anaerolineaceae bacterium]|nr:YetF domain-containing protein [Anaerolineaceae bacterium]
MLPNLPTFLLLAAIAVRTLIVIIILFIAVRLLGRRAVGGMNMIDVIAILLVGNAVQNTLTYGSGRLEIGLVSSAVLILTETAIIFLISRRPNLEQTLIGQPTVIFSDGYIDRRKMERQGVEEEELLEAVHSMGLSDLSQVHLAVLEENGSISVIPKVD